MSGVLQNTMCPPKLILGAHQDARSQPKFHIITKTKSGSVPRCWFSP